MDVVNDNRQLDPLVKEEKIIGVLDWISELLGFLCSNLPTTPRIIPGIQDSVATRLYHGVRAEPAGWTCHQPGG